MLLDDSTRNLSVTAAGATVMPFHVARPKQKIARQGEAATFCYLVVQGVLARTMSAPGGKRQIVGFHIAGDVCGNVVSATAAADYTIEALSEATFVRIPTRSLSELIKDSRVVARHADIDAAVARQWIFNLGQRPAYQRVAHLLCEMEARMRAGGLARDGTFKWHGTQSDMGAAMGLSLVHTNKTLKRLDKAGLANWHGNVVTIGDLAALRKVAGFDPAYLGLGQQTLAGFLSSRIAGRSADLHAGNSIFRPDETRYVNNDQTKFA